jgi:hypothetical protein
MAVFNKDTGMYEARKLMSYDGTLLVGQGDTKEEADKDLKEGIKIWKSLKLEKTNRGTYARDDLAEYIGKPMVKVNEK